MLKMSRGFTLIELIVVIVILAILAAVALPKFTGLQNDARTAKLNTARASVVASASLIHSSLLARSGTPDSAPCAGGGGTADNSIGATGTVCTEAGIVKLVNAYPASAPLGEPGIIAAAGLSSTTMSPTLAQLNTEGYGVVVVADKTTISVVGGAGTTGSAGAQVNASCSFSYQEAVPRAVPQISVLDTTGC